MKNILYNRLAACVFFAVMLAVSTLGLGGNDLKQAAEEIEGAFYNAPLAKHEEQSVYISPNDECLTVMNNANNLLIIAERYLDKNDKGINDMREALAKDGDYHLIADSAQKVINPFNQMVDRLDNMEISDKDKDYLIVMKANVDAAVSKIRASTYNTQAEEFNSSISNFYTGFIAKVRGVKKAPVVFE